MARPRDFVEAGLYRSEQEVIEVALSEFLDHHPDMRLALAARLYERDEEWSIGGIAQWAGVTRWEMMDILADRGVELRLGPATMEEAREEAATLERWLRQDRSEDAV